MLTVAKCCDNNFLVLCMYLNIIINEYQFEARYFTKQLLSVSALIIAGLSVKDCLLFLNITYCVMDRHKVSIVCFFFAISWFELQRM